MSKSISVIPKKEEKRGRPATGRDPVLPVRISLELREKIERWADMREISRSEAIRRLIQLGLQSREESSK